MFLYKLVFFQLIQESMAQFKFECKYLRNILDSLSKLFSFLLVPQWLFQLACKCCVRVLRRVLCNQIKCEKFGLICIFNLQGLLLCPQTLSQTRRARLRRAFTEATGDTVTYVKTVGFKTLVHRQIPQSTVQSIHKNFYLFLYLKNLLKTSRSHC